MTDVPTTRCPKCRRIVSKSEMTYEHVRPRFLDAKPSGRTKICRECNQNAAIGQANDYQALAVSLNKEPYKAFLSALYEVDALLLFNAPDEQLAHSLRRILYSAIITAMETYLADTFINRVVQNEVLLRRCVETNPELKTRKLDLGEIFERYNGVAREVRDYLLNVLFHNLAKVSQMYQSVLKVSFPPAMDELFRSVERRHDIVHRSGKSKSGTAQIVSEADLKRLLSLMKTFVQTIEEQLT